jgi:hypothetical protein
MKVHCPHCSQPLEAPAELAGQTVPCPTCQGMLSLPAPAVVAAAPPARAGLPVGWVIGLTALIVALAATVIGLLVVRKGSGLANVSRTRSATPPPVSATAVAPPANPTPPPPAPAGEVSDWATPTLPPADAQGWVTLFDGQRLHGVSLTNANLVAGRILVKDGLLSVDSTAGYNGGIQFNWQSRNVAIRVQAKLVSGQNFLLGIDPYAAFHNGSTLYGFGYGDNGWHDLKGTNLPPAGGGFADLEFRIQGGTITLLANGTTAATMKAPLIRDSYRVGIGTVNGLSLFKKIEVKELAGTAPDAAAATPAAVDVPEPAGPPPIDIQWQRTFGGVDLDEALAIQETKDGGYIAVGSSASPVGGTKTSPLFGKNDWWLLRLDATGQKLWEKAYGGPEWEVARAVVEVEGGFLITGVTDSKVEGNKSAPPLGKRDTWLVKVDSRGEKQWEKSLGGADGDAAWQLHPAGPDRYYLAGGSASPISPGKRSPNFGGLDFWLVALDGTGQVVWDRTFGGDKFEAAYGLALDPNGGAVLVGGSESGASGNKASVQLGGSGDAWIVRVDSQGQEVWQRALGGTGWDDLFAAVPADDSGFLSVGTSFSAPGGSKSSPSFGANDIWVVRLDARGKTVWEQTFGGTGKDVARSVVKTRDGGFLVMAETESGRSGNKTTPNFGNQDTWLIRLNAKGEKLWEMTLGGSEEDRCWSLASTRDGGYIIGGSSASVPNQSKTALHYGGKDAWFIKLAPEK